MQACWHVDVNHKSQSRFTPSLVFQLTPRAAELGRYGFSSIARTIRLMEYGKRPRNRRHTNVRNTPLPPPPNNSVQPSHHQPLLYITFTQAITRIAQIVWLGGGGGVSLCNTCHQTLSLLCRGITKATTTDVFPSKGDKVIGTGAYRKHQAMAR